MSGSTAGDTGKGRVPRRHFLAGVGAAAVAVPVGLPVTGGGPATAAGAPTGPSPFPDFPAAGTTTTEDRAQMLWQLGITPPALPPRAEDPNRPPNARPVDPANTEGNWTDPLGHTVARAAFGQWITYDDDAGLAGGAASPAGDYGPFSNPRYTDIDLLTTKHGAPVRTPQDWWMRRRPEILRDVQDNLYGHIPHRDRWPAITWSVGAVTTGTANGVAYQERVITGTIDISGYPEVRNVPKIQGTLRTPLDKAGQPVPVFIEFGSAAGAWQFTAPHGYGVFGYNSGLLQPDSGGANLSSYIIGLVNKGHWRRPGDWGALAAWSWGISRLIDYFGTDPEVDATRIGVHGHSRFGKATLVAAAYDERVAAAYPSSAGALGTSWARRAWGETLELVCGADTEYHWVAGNIMRYAGELNPGTYWPRKVENLPVDVHCVMSLVAPRIIFTNGGTDIPPGFGDAWTDPRGMYLAGAVSSVVWNHLGWPGQIIPEGTVFTSGPGESIGGTPPIDVAFIEGTIGWRRHHEGHTPAPDWPSFLQMVSRHFTDNRPVVTSGQRFTLGEGPVNVVGTVRATDADNDTLGNWQITGGRRAGAFAIDRDAFAIDRGTGEITIANARSLDLVETDGYTLTVTVDDGKLASTAEVVTIDVPDRINICHRGRTISVPKRAVRSHLRHGDAIGRCT
jgi:hypothetical protein